MRTDVKVGVLFSLVICLVGGFYYLLSDKDQEPIDLSQGTSARSSETGAQPVDAQSTRVKPGSRQGGDSMLADGRRQPRPTPRAARPSTGVAPRTRGGPIVKQPARGPKPTSSGRSDESPSLPSSSKETGGDRPGPDRPEDAERRADGGGGSRTAERPQRVADASQTSSKTPSASSDIPQRLTASESASRRSTEADIEPPTADRLKEAVNDRHRVQPGDTLAGLALTYYGSEQHAGFLAQANPQIKDPRRLAVGQMIEIPPNPSPASVVGTRQMAAKGPERPTTDRDDAPAEKQAGKSPQTYVVKPGDTLYGIAQGLLGTGTRWREIFELNKTVIGNNPDNLRPGQRLSLPPAN